jgi:pyrrolidone-carboxylate peptidase
MFVSNQYICSSVMYRVLEIQITAWEKSKIGFTFIRITGDGHLSEKINLHWVS